jgi:hypothetical protein
MIKPASNTSRKTITNEGSTGTSRRVRRKISRHDQETLGRMVEIVEKIVTARFQWPHVHDRFAARGNHFLDVESVAFEFGGDRAEILDGKGDRFSRRRVHFGGLEQVILDGKRDCYRLIRARDTYAWTKYGCKHHEA